MKECKYRLPCNWCDKFEKHCNMIDDNSCEHDWLYIGDNMGGYPCYICSKCQMLSIRQKPMDDEGVENE